ncbi:hypothetical protein [Sedimenticola selenatireducens]|uniref:hypothetical protein n=1 Tax=Sedimenticola selenatireducens TaxID=191960 RepID=UPI00048C6850|nr:hypothetical protein [Sedimenticola selenatireducens]
MNINFNQPIYQKQNMNTSSVPYDIELRVICSIWMGINQASNIAKKDSGRLNTIDHDKLDKNPWLRARI